MRIQHTLRLVAALALAACEGQGRSGSEPEAAAGIGVASAAATGPVQTVVVNTDSNPVPTTATGTTTVAGTVAATQSGAWSVGIAGTPAVTAAQSGAWAVGISGNVSLAPGTSVLAEQGGAPWSVSLSGTPTVSVAGTPSVNIANSPSVSVAGTPTVAIANPAAAPANVRNGDEPGRHFYQHSITVTVPASVDVSSGFFPALPSGKRLVVESVSAEVFVGKGEIALVVLVTNAGGSATAQPLAPSRLGALDATHDVWQASHPLRAYVDANSSTNLAVDCARGVGTSTGSFSEEESCAVTVAGYLVDL